MSGFFRANLEIFILERTVTHDRYIGAAPCDTRLSTPRFRFRAAEVPRFRCARAEGTRTVYLVARLHIKIYEKIRYSMSAEARAVSACGGGLKVEFLQSGRGPVLYSLVVTSVQISI